MSEVSLLRRAAPYVLVALAFLATPIFEYSLLPGYYSVIIHLLPVALAALVLSARGVTIVAALAFAVTLFYAFDSPMPLEVKVGRLLSFLVIAYVAVRLGQERERAVQHAREEAARQTERRERARLAAVLQQMPSGVMIAEAPAGVVTFANERVRRIWPELKSLPDGDVALRLCQGLHADGLPYAPEEWPLARALATGEVVVDEEIAFPRSDGAPGALSASAAPVRDEQGRIVAAVTVLTDITERKQAEAEREQLLAALQDLTQRLQSQNEELQSQSEELVSQNEELQSQGAELRDLNAALVTASLEGQQQRQRAETNLAQLHAVFDAIDEGVLVEDLENNVVLANAAEASIFGLASPAEMERSLSDLASIYELYVDGQPLPLEQWPLARALRGESFANQEMRARRRDSGREWILSVSGQPVRDREGRLILAVVAMRDITERKHGELERERLLAENQRRAAELQAIIDSMVDGVLAYNADGVVILANKLARELLGLVGAAEEQVPVAEIPQRARLRHLDGSPILPDETASARALAGEMVATQDQIAYNQETRRDMYVRASGAPIRNDKGQIAGAVVVVRDVTELTELDRLKDQFIQVAAHELKTPVTIMKGYAQALLRSGQGSPPQRKMLDAIDRGTDRIERIINDLLDISKMQTGSLELHGERIDLPQLVEEQVDRLALTVTKHRVRLVKAQPVVIQGDRDRLEQVLSNLLDNAIRYSPEGGDVDVAVRLEGDEVIVAVADQGVGIPTEKQGRIFERFYRAHTDTPYDYGGMGVGLYISREIVRRHGGRVWFESEAGVGSTFYFTVPLK